MFLTLILSYFKGVEIVSKSFNFNMYKETGDATVKYIFTPKYVPLFVSHMQKFVFYEMNLFSGKVLD